jgi:hypothetical protein
MFGRPGGSRTASPCATTAAGALRNMYGFQRVSPSARSQMPGALRVPAGAAPPVTCVVVAPSAVVPDGSTVFISMSCSR